LLQAADDLSRSQIIKRDN